MSEAISMAEIEVDEQEFDSPTLLDYLAHGLLGYRDYHDL
jgi:hypothetical protein